MLKMPLDVDKSSDSVTSSFENQSTKSEGDLSKVHMVQWELSP